MAWPEHGSLRAARAGGNQPRHAAGTWRVQVGLTEYESLWGWWEGKTETNKRGRWGKQQRWRDKKDDSHVLCASLTRVTVGGSLDPTLRLIHTISLIRRATSTATTRWDAVAIQVGATVVTNNCSNHCGSQLSTNRLILVGRSNFPILVSRFFTKPPRTASMPGSLRTPS